MNLKNILLLLVLAVQTVNASCLTVYDIEEQVMYAASNGQLDRLQGLLKNQSRSIVIVLYYAINYKQIEIVKFLLQQGVNPDQKCNGEIPLILAVRHSTKDIVNMLLHGGANPNEQNQYSDTPLIVAARNNEEDIAKALLLAGANINKANKDGNTPLLFAVKTGNVSFLTMLLANGAKFNWSNNHGLTALDEAISNLQFDVGNTKKTKMYKDVVAVLLLHNVDYVTKFIAV